MALPRLFVLGDSISMQYGPYLQAMLAGQFAYDRKQGPTKSMSDLEVPQNANGGDSSLCLLYLQDRQREGGLACDLLLLNCGLHDTKCKPHAHEQQVPLERYEGNLRAMVALVRSMGIELVWVRTTPVCEATHNTERDKVWRYQKDVDRYNLAADAIMKKAGVPVIDLHGMTLTLGPMDKLSPEDGRHFLTATQQAHAAYIAGWLLRHVAGRH